MGLRTPNNYKLLQILWANIYRLAVQPDIPRINYLS